MTQHCSEHNHCVKVPHGQTQISPIFGWAWKGVSVAKQVKMQIFFQGMNWATVNLEINLEETMQK